jgi:hypothetical protein
MKKSDTLPTEVENAEPSASSGNASARLVTVAATLAVAAPLLLASPSADEVDSARADLAFLREVAASKTERVTHPLLQHAMAMAEQPQDASYVQQHIQDHFENHWMSVDVPIVSAS